MKLKFAEPSGGLGVRVGSGTVSPARVGGGRGLTYTMPINLAKGGKSCKTCNIKTGEKSKRNSSSGW